MDKKTRSQNQNESPKPSPRSSGSTRTDSSVNKTNVKSGATTKPKSSCYSGIKFVMNPKKTTVVKPFSFDRKKKDEGTPSCSTEKKVEKEVIPESKDAEGKVHVVMDTLKISRSEEYTSEESSSLKIKSSSSPVEKAECVKKEDARCSRMTKLLTNLFVEKPARAKSPSKDGSTASAKKESSETVLKKECTRCKGNTPDLLKTPKSEVKPLKDKFHLKENLMKSCDKRECTRSSTAKKPAAEPPKDQKTEVKTRTEAPKSEEAKSHPIKKITAKPACSKIAKLQQANKPEVKTSKTSQAKSATDVQVSAVDSTVTEITQNTYVSKESVVISSQTSNTESFCITEESVSSSEKTGSGLKLSVLSDVEEKQVLLNGSQSGFFYVTEDECNLLNGTAIVSEILEEAKYEAESLMQTKDVQEIQKSTSKIPRKTQGIVKMNGNVVKEAIAEELSFENRCPNSMDQPANHEESLLVN